MINWAKLGMVALDTILKLSISDPAKSAIVDGTLKIFDMLGDNYFDKRKLQRQHEAISDKIAASCNAILDYHSIEAERKAAIIEDIAATIESIGVSYSTVFEKKFNFEEFLRLFNNASQAIIEHYDTRENELFERLLRHVDSVSWHLHVLLY